VPELLISIVSHRQGALVGGLFEDLRRVAPSLDAVVALTLNVPEALPFEPSAQPFAVKLIENQEPRGYSSNHNAAFRASKSSYFCVLNPDIRFQEAPFPALARLLNRERVGVAAPLVVDERGDIEDSARRVPTPWSILAKAVVRSVKLEYPIGSDVFYPDWAAGMFLALRSDLFEQLGGFDERYFLYYEDVDLCCRVRLAGFRVAVDPTVRVVHAARRESHRNLGYMGKHLASMTRFFLSPVFFRSLKLATDEPA
jgi:hypothetical protein